MQQILTPINDEYPFGADIQYEDIYEQLDAEIKKDDDVTRAEIDWELVRSISIDITTNYSKDIRVINYLIYALIALGSFDEAISAIERKTELYDKGWDSLFPSVKKERQRKEAEVWIVDKMSAFLKNNSNSVALKADKLSLLEKGMRISADFAGKRLNSGIDLGDLEKAIGVLRSNLKVDEHRETKETVKQKKREEQRVIDKVENRAQYSNVVKNVVEQLKKAIEYVATEENGRLEAIKLRRVVNQLLLLGKPPRDANGNTQVYPVSTGVVQKIERLREEGSSEELFELLESMLTKAPYWMAVHPYTLDVVDKEIGLSEAETVVVKAYINLIREQSIIYGDEKFANGELMFPVELNRQDQSRDKMNQDAAVNKTSMWDLVTMINKGKIDDGLRAWKREESAAGNVRESYDVHMKMADAFLHTGRTEVSLRILDGLVNGMKQRTAIEWDRGLYVDLLKLKKRILKDKLRRAGKEDEKQLVGNQLEGITTELVSLDVYQSLSDLKTN